MTPATEATLSIGLALETVATVERAGIARSHFLRLAQFDPARLECPEGRLSYSELYRMLELALNLIEDPALGLHEAEAMSGGSYNLIAHLVGNSATLREGLTMLLQFQNLVGDNRFQMVEDERSTTIRSRRLRDEPPRVVRFFAELNMTCFLRLARHFRPCARAEQVNFEYAAPAHLSEYHRIFEGAERFDQPYTSIVLDRALMDAPAPYHDQELHRALLTEAEKRFARLVQRTSYAQRVYDYIAQQPTPCRAELDAVAQSVGLSARTLRRRLLAEGTSYQAVVGNVLASLAAQRLLVERRTIQETAYLMGYTSSGAFHRAFKRWTGMTPNEFLARNENTSSSE